MWVCVCIWAGGIYVCVCECISIHICVYHHMSEQVSVCVCLCMSRYVCIHLHFVCIYTSMCVYMALYVLWECLHLLGHYVFVYVCVYTWICICIYVGVHVCACLHMHAFVSVNGYASVYVNLCMHVSKCFYGFVQVHVYIYRYKYIHILTYAHTCV